MKQHLALICGVLLGWATPAQAESTWQLFPKEHLYPRYAADPQRPAFNAQLQNYHQTSIVAASQQRIDLKMGGALLLAQWQEPADNVPWLQVLLEAGIHAQFDAALSLDNIGWDGLYGWYLALRQSPTVVWRVGIGHISAHVGDEWMQRTGRQRLGYTRQERRIGVSWALTNNTVTYLDVGHGYVFGNEQLQKTWRIQTGLQWDKPNQFWENRLGWYVATDLSSYQENDWHGNVALQVGLLATNRERRWRLGLEAYRGRAQLGEYFQETEQYLGVGLWLDI